jgi:hypothetical protein
MSCNQTDARSDMHMVMCPGLACCNIMMVRVSETRDVFAQSLVTLQVSSRQDKQAAGRGSQGVQRAFQKPCFNMKQWTQTSHPRVSLRKASIIWEVVECRRQSVLHLTAGALQIPSIVLLHSKKGSGHVHSRLRSVICGQLFCEFQNHGRPAGDQGVGLPVERQSVCAVHAQA